MNDGGGAGRRAWTALAAALAIHLLFLQSLASGALDPLFNDTTHRGAPGSDFFVVYKAGRNLLRGDSPYRIDPDEPPRSWSDYRYLPLSAMTVSAAVATLPPETARRLWLVFNEILLAAAIAVSVRLARTRREGLVAASLWLAFSPFYVELFIGQCDFLVAVGLLGAAVALLGRAPLAGEGAWFAATSVKWVGLLLAPLMLRRGRWRALAIWLLAAGATGAVYFALRPADLQPLRATILRGGFATPHAGNHGFQALLSSVLPLFDPGLFHDLARWREPGVLILSGAILQRAILALAVLVALAATFRGRRPLTVGEGVALWTSLLAVAWNEFWEHQYVLLLPGLVLLYLEGRRRLALGVWWPLALPTIFALLDRPHAEVVAATPAGYDNPDLFLLLSAPANILLHACKAVPALVLFVAAARSAWRPGEAREPLAGDARA